LKKGWAEKRWKRMIRYRLGFQQTRFPREERRIILDERREKEMQDM